MSADQPCRVWWAAPVDPDTAPALVALLDDLEQDRLHRFRRAADRARYLAAHALTRIVLGELLDTPAAMLVFDRTCRCGQQHGKPVLPAPGSPGFSMSHAGDLVGLAVSPSGAVGIDVEQVRATTDLAGMAGHVYSPTELTRTSRADAGAFFTAWTRKEALLKATGDGLATPMTTITLGPGGVEAWTGASAPDGPVWLRDLQPAPGYPAAVAGFGATAPAIVESDGNALLA
ncbi:4'-phosphopantetheinyl transferase family protein [Pseudonocardia sp. GCM10023141]|uniref:4'-phosphopantetheinyl transferase family protein n=1 Tax=Pseudonocardia sp. GCM10023141 TaxID=3252653 RepID=UPI00362135F1